MINTMPSRYYIWIRCVAVGLLVVGCTANRYAETNKVYKEQVKALAGELSLLPSPPEAGPITQYVPDADSVVFSENSGPAAGSWVGTVNFNLRKPNYVIIHHTAQDSLEQTLHTFTVTHTQVSAHYVIGREGEVYQLLNDYLRGWHAGVGKWGNITDLNSVSLGIELDNNGREPFSEAQLYSLIRLLGRLKAKYNIPAANFIGHGDIAPTRKNDPSVLFPWKRLAEAGFGLWPGESAEVPPEGFNPKDALRIIGYDVSDYGAAVTAFKRHYIPNDPSPGLTTENLKVLYSLYLEL